MWRTIAVITLGALLGVFAVRYEDRYDRSKMPWDLRPVSSFIGLWQLESTQGQYHDLPPPTQLDYAINPIPKFGARAINITHTFFNQHGDVIRGDYGFMPVKNATKRDPRVHVAYLTTSSEGWSMMEQGVVKGGKMTFHLKQFLRRTFDVGNNNNNLEIREFERQIEQTDSNHLIVRVRAETAFGTEAYTAFYRRILG